MANWRDCVGLALGRPLKDSEAAALEGRFENARRRARFAGEAFDDAAIGAKIAAELETEKALAKRSVLLNQIAYKTLRAYDASFGDKSLAVRAKLAGINEIVEGGRDSVDARYKAIFGEQLLGGMLADMRKAGSELGADLVKLANTREMELPIRQALRGEKIDDPIAMKIAEIFNKYFETGRLRENRAGSWIGHLDDYGGGQSHDARRVFRAGGRTPRTAAESAASFQAWKDFTLPLLDTDRIFPEFAGRSTPDEFLRAIWNAIAADRWDTAKGGEFTGFHHFLGPANLAERRSAHRVLHFKDAAAAQAYNDRFGHGSLMENVLARLERSARAIALMEELGPNPEAMLRRWRRDLEKEAQSSGDIVGAQRLAHKKIDHIENLFAEVSGATREAADKDLGHWASVLRAIESMAKLGFATLSSIGDIASVAAELRYQGRGFLSSYADAFAGLMRGRGSGETRMIADLLGVGFQSITGGVHARFHSTDGAAGAATRLLNHFFRWNVLNWWTDTHQTTSGLVTSRYFALQRDIAWGNLPAEASRLLTQYGIGQGEWNVLRKGAVKKGADGTEFLTAAAVREVPESEFVALAGRRYTALGPRALADARDRLATSYGALVIDRADFAVPTPGARERALMNFGTERGTVLGEALRFVMQFKAFPLAQISKTLGREIYGRRGEHMGAAVRMGELVLQLTAMGYLAMTAKDLVRGKEPADPLNVNTFLRAMTQGGGLGIYGDFILGEHDRFGRSPAETALGPAAGTAGDVIRLVNKTIRGDLDAPGAIRFAVANTPFLNLFYARPALDYFVLHPIYESLKPGYTRRLQREAEQRYGQDYWIY